MTTQWDRFRDRLRLNHGDDFGFDKAEFYNYSSGTYDPDEGRITGENRNLIGKFDVELIPPGIDSTVDVDGTNFDWTTSIRFPQDAEDKTYSSDTTIAAGEVEQYDNVTVESGVTLTVNGTLIVYNTLTNNGTVDASSGTQRTLNNTNLVDTIIPLGQDNERPTEVEIQSGDGSNEVFELHGYSIEQASEMLMCRLVER